jgi:hypothetical protein
MVNGKNVTKEVSGTYTPVDQVWNPAVPVFPPQTPAVSRFYRVVTVASSTNVLGKSWATGDWAVFEPPVSPPVTDQGSWKKVEKEVIKYGDEVRIQQKNLVGDAEIGVGLNGAQVSAILDPSSPLPTRTLWTIDGGATGTELTSQSTFSLKANNTYISKDLTYSTNAANKAVMRFAIGCVSTVGSVSFGGDPNQAREVNRSDSNLLTCSTDGLTAGDCALPIVYNWSISPTVEGYTPGFNDTGNEPTGQIFKGPNLNIPAFTLAPQTSYTVSVSIGTIGEPTFRSASVQLDVRKQKLVAKISAAPDAIRVDSPLTLSGSESTDPDVKDSVDLTGYKYTWKCTTADGNSQIQDVVGKIATYPAETLTAGTYKFTLHFELPDGEYDPGSDYYSDEAVKCIEVRDGEVLAVLVSENPLFTFEGPSINVGTKVRLIAHLGVDTDGDLLPLPSGATISWSVTPLPTELTNWFTNPNATGPLDQSTINLPNANFVNGVPQYLWTINEEYTATVTVTTGEGTNDVKSGTASYVFNTQSVPYIEGSKPFASASVSEPYVQGVTEVTLHAGDWTTEAASGATGLTYVFFRVSSFGGDVILSSQSSTNTFTTSSLPYGTLEGNNELAWGVKAYSGDLMARELGGNIRIIQNPN